MMLEPMDDDEQKNKRLEIFERYENFARSGYVVNERTDRIEIALIALLKKISLLTSRPLTEEKIKMYITELIKDIHNNYSWIRNDELRYAFEQGAKGVYGTVFDISYTSLTNWIRMYRDSEERKTFIELNNKPSGNHKQIASHVQQTREQHAHEMAKIAWDIFTIQMKDKNSINPYFFLLLPDDAYQYLLDQKLIAPTVEEKTKIRSTVVAMLKSNDFVEKNSMFIPTFIQHDKDAAREDYIRSCCRKYVVAVYFNKLILDKKTFQ